MANRKPTTSRELLLGIAAFGLMLAGVGLLLPRRAPDVQGALVGKAAPEATAETVSGGSWKLADHRGRVVLLNFWAFWCAPCVAEMPSLRQLEERLSKQAFDLVLVHVGEGVEEGEQIPSLPRRRVARMPDEIVAAYGIQALPHSVLIDREGRVRAEFAGPQDWTSPEVLALIEALF